MNIPGAYYQRDPRWGSHELGYNTDPSYNIANYGCLVTAIANMLWYMGHPEMNPDVVNSILKQRSGFVDGGVLVWGAVNGLASDLRSQGTTNDLAAAERFVAAEGNFAILQVTKPGFPMHFVVLPLVGQIIDSWDGHLKPVGSYQFITAHLYGDTTPDFVASPQPPVSPAPQAANQDVQFTPTSQDVTIQVEPLEVRTGPGTGYPGHQANTPDHLLHNGQTVHITGIATGDNVTLNNKTSNLWGRSATNPAHYFALAGTSYVSPPPPPPPAPASAPAGTQRKIIATAKANYRSAPELGQNIIKAFDPGAILDFKGFVHGANVDGNDVWFVGAHTGGYAWSGDFEDTGTHDLPDLTPPPAPPPPPAPEPTPAPAAPAPTPEPPPEPAPAVEPAPAEAPAEPAAPVEPAPAVEEDPVTPLDPPLVKVSNKTVYVSDIESGHHVEKVPADIPFTFIFKVNHKSVQYGVTHNMASKESVQGVDLSQFGPAVDAISGPSASDPLGLSEDIPAVEKEIKGFLGGAVKLLHRAHKDKENK